MHPGSQANFFGMLKQPRWEDFEWRVEGGGSGSGRGKGGRGNRFAYLVNGFSIGEVDGGDYTWYWGKRIIYDFDDGWVEFNG